MTLNSLFLASLASCGWNTLERPYRSSSVTEGAPNLGQNHRWLKFVPTSSAKIQFEIKHVFSNTLKTPALPGPNREETVMKQEKGKDGRIRGAGSGEDCQGKHWQWSEGRSGEDAHRWWVSECKRGNLGMQLRSLSLTSWLLRDWLCSLNILWGFVCNIVWIWKNAFVFTSK